MSSVIHHVRRTAFLQDGGGMTDGQLLECFLARQEEAAFEALVRRHGPMVLGVCRRVLHNAHDAEDAFQATFLVLVRKAASLRPQQVIGNWLYGVAYRTALKARAATLRRRTREAQVRDMPRPETPTAGPEQDWQPLLDQELSRLPDKYREPIVLCDLQGKTRKEAARQVGLAEGTLSGRLTTARRMLARRLARRGVTLSVGSLAAVLSEQAVSACVPAPLISSTVQAAALLAAGQTAAGVISVQAAALTEGVVQAMSMTRFKVTVAFLIVAGLLGVGSGVLAHRALAGTTADPPVVASDQPATLPAAEQERAAQRPKAQPKDGTNVTGALLSADADKNSVTVRFSSRTEGQTEKTYAVAKDAKILRDGKEIKLADLKQRARVSLKLSPDQKTALSISVLGQALTAQVKSVDAVKSTVTVTIDNVRKGKFDKTHPVAKDARVTLDGKQAKLADLKEGATLVFTLSAEDNNTVIQVQTPPRRTRPDGKE
ncbi:MAG: sigma-70 family RNA polymerase sigma factor [Gemmataceae bacterium]|nr:sigma-70 family RNA polymerase sigma factor [Gemmataceae bacterium]